MIKPELTGKYAKDQTVWYLNDENKSDSFVIYSIEEGEEDGQVIYTDNDQLHSGWLESELFATRGELIDAQILWWEGIKRLQALTEPKKCDHNFDECNEKWLMLQCTKCGFISESNTNE